MCEDCSRSFYLCVGCIFLSFTFIYVYIPRGKKRRIKMLHGVLQGYKWRACMSEHQSGRLGNGGVSPFEFRNWFDKNLCGPLLPWLLSTYEMDSFSTKCTFIPLRHVDTTAPTTVSPYNSIEKSFPAYNTKLRLYILYMYYART